MESNNSVDITDIMIKRSETEKLITEKSRKLISKLENMKLLIDEEKKKSLYIDMRISTLVNESVSMSNEFEQSKLKIEELQQQCMKIDTEMDKSQSKKLRADTILLKEENTINNYYNDINKQKEILESFRTSLCLMESIKELEEKNSALLIEKNNLIKELERIKSTSAAQKKKLHLENKISSNRIGALKRKLEKRIS